MKPVVELQNVTKVIRGRKIIDDLSFGVMPGEVFGFLGPNGAGKTTTIRMIVGLIRMSGGDITICGKNIKKEFEEAIRHVGAIVENPEMYKFLTGYQNLQQAARLSPGIGKEKIDEVVELVGLTERIHDKVKTYSLGMRQRLGIAQSLLHDPKVLILDEPTNGLDPAGIREIRDYLRSLAKERNLAVIVSSHLLSEMEMMCDRIAIIQKGKLIDMQMVKEEESVQKHTYICMIDQPQKAKDLLEKKDYLIQVQPGGFSVQLEKEQVPEVINYLVHHDLLIYEMKKQAISLEDRFLEITNQKAVKANA
ncbi:ABC transporter ATP-binding protein [Lederbergia galactosidilytica]|uniref:Bacitracin ABC transporter ATP-binding protein n=1 Tax=Lederbergia galactosidilytica TaxID=217031 RepID=A0A177ZQY3_9BACI|nr:ABC transporter ATP-binding protein [Lederbergia galactosidilytica]KRG12951.1 bacitracin ABC transporter ATP-binding protein [Virgibacillus soli]OAK70184.1 bacitracin ABC transporter ATP-binding protein [Lederbergia galactosidilytica]